MHVYLATGLSASQLEQDEDEVISLEKVPTSRAAALIDSGELRDAKSITAVLLAARKLGW
jgi:ADP-ribose pyrophosphatase